MNIFERIFTSWITVLVSIVLLTSLRIWDPVLVERTRLATFDLYQQQQERVDVPNIVLVEIDEKSLQQQGQYPWPREQLGALMESQPGAVPQILTMLLAEEDRWDGDNSFATTMQKVPTLLGSAPTTQLKEGLAPHVGTATIGGDASNFTFTWPGIISPLEKLSNNAYGVGVMASVPEVDGVVRRVPLVVNANSKLYPSLALETIRVLAGEPSYTLKVTDYGIEKLRIGRGKTFPMITTQPNGDVFVSYWNNFEKVSAADLPSRDDLQGKILIWGAIAEGVAQPIPTPVGGMYPHEVQANILTTVMNGTTIVRPAWSTLAEIASVFFLGLSILGLVYLTPLWLQVIAVPAIVGGVYTTSSFFWTSKLQLIDISFVLFTILLVFAHSSFNNFYRNYKLKQQIKQQFGTYVSPDLVKQLQKDPSLLRLGGERREMTFLFMDICGFTPISEYYKENDDPEGLVELVNEFLDEMTTIILRNGGTIDKYMGDCIMAFWNAPLPCDNHADQAVRSAVQIEEAINALKKQYAERGLPDINVGTGINTGTCIVGNMGSKTRFDYSVIGDAVNLAARLEATAGRGQYEKNKTIISRATQLQLGPDFVTYEIGTIQVKGKKEKIRIYSPKLLT